MIEPGGPTVVNLTPHLLVVRTAAGDITVPRSLTPARVDEVAVCAEPLPIDGLVVDVVDVSYRDGVSGLPDPAPGVVYVVSRVTAAVAARPDVFFPYGEIRDDDGRVVACRGLARFR